MTKLTYEIDWEKQLKESESEEELSLQQQLNLPDEVLELYYKACIQLFEEKKLEEASDGFLFLIHLNPTVFNVWFSYGLIEQTQYRFEEALNAYTVAQTLDPTNPIVYAHLFQCYVALEQIEAAEKTFQKFVDIAGENQEYDDIKKIVLKIHENIGHGTPQFQLIPKPNLCTEFEEPDQLINDMVESERDSFQSKIETFEMYAARKKASLVEKRDEFLAHIQNGYKVIIKTIPLILTNYEVLL